MKYLTNSYMSVASQSKGLNWQFIFSNHRPSTANPKREVVSIFLQAAKALLGLFLSFKPYPALSTYNAEFVTLAVQ